MISINISKGNKIIQRQQNDGYTNKDLEDVMIGIEQVKQNQVTDWNEVYDELKAELQSNHY